jgi:hypothetical protein
MAVTCSVSFWYGPADTVSHGYSRYAEITGCCGNFEVGDGLGIGGGQPGGGKMKSLLTGSRLLNFNRP